MCALLHINSLCCLIRAKKVGYNQLASREWNQVITVFMFYSGVPAIVDFAAMRDAVKSLGGDPKKINPVCPVDLVIDHSVQVDFVRRLSDSSLI